jgi:hypothetical protein
MMHLSDLIQINQHSGDAAVNVARSLSNHNLVDSFSPTKAAVTVLKHLRDAVLPLVDGKPMPQEYRALNVYGSYGSGKSHLSVVIAQLLRDGCGDASFIRFFERLNHFGEAQLAENLKNTFLAQGDKDAKPYLLVSLEGQGLPSIGSVLMKELYDEVKRRGLNPAEILPATEYDVCIKRFEEICRNSPELANTDLSQWNLHQYLTTAYLLDALKSHDPDSLETFKHWHKAVCLGSEFNPVNEGGSNFISAYTEAGKNLAEKHSFAGILIVWDEFGGALEDLLRNPNRNASGEILDLQRFVETVCSPAQGHTIFIGLTHVSAYEYGVRMNCDDMLKKELEKIFGIGTTGSRFKSFKIELSAAESEGYHLLGMQKSWNDYGKAQLNQFRANQENVVGVCSALPLFKNLGHQLTQVSDEIYPLHPIMAAGLFGLSALAQATRTALTFFRDNQEMINSRPISERGLFTDELIRLTELVDYYGDAIKKNKAHEFERYQRAANKIPVTESRGKSDILKLLLLADFLGENFQTNETFLACALYDTSPVSALDLQADLNYLKQAQLIWKNDATQQWTLLGDSGVNVEGLIEAKLNHFAGRSAETLFNNHPEMCEDLLPMLGEHELEPSPCGIVRSYQVSLLTAPFQNNLKLNNSLISGQVYLVLGNEPADIDNAKLRIQETANSNIFFWLPTHGIRSESVNYEGHDFKFTGLLCRYLAVELLLKEKTATDDLRRQLNAKLDRTRDDLLKMLQIFFGREGLTSGKSEIIQAGTAHTVNCKSWYEFKNFLYKTIQAEYEKEIPIRANNMNALNDESYTGKSKVLKIVERILDFETHPTYQTDLLGEPETSELAALIDGVIGANELFVQRKLDSWDIKTVDETEGRIYDVLKLLHDNFVRKREKPYSIVELREKLIAAPFGIPSCNLAILAAVAIRHEVKRLRFGSCGNETDFATNLTAAFVKDSKITIRLHEFSPKQLVVLKKLNAYFHVFKEFQQSDEDFAGQAVSELRTFISTKSELIKQSPKLHADTKELVKLFQVIGKSQQDIADKLVELFGGENTANLLKTALDDFARIEDEKRFELTQGWQNFLTQIEPHKADLTLRLTHDRASELAKRVGQLLENESPVMPNDLTIALLGLEFEKCEERDIFRGLGQLESLVDYNPPQPKHVPMLPPIIEPDKNKNIENSDISSIVTMQIVPTTENLTNQLRQQIRQFNAPNDLVKLALQQLLAEYER